MNKQYVRFLPEKEYVDDFVSRGLNVPPFIALMPYVERDGVWGYIVPCSPDDPDAEEAEGG